MSEESTIDNYILIMALQTPFLDVQIDYKSDQSVLVDIFSIESTSYNTGFGF